MFYGVFFANRYEKMWGDECYYSIEGECEFFQDWLKQTKDEVSIIRYCHMHQKAILHQVD